MFKKIVLASAILVGANTLSAMEALWTGIFAHGLGDNAGGRRHYVPILGRLVGAHGPEWARRHGLAAGPGKSCLAQQGDIDVVVDQIRAHPAGPFFLAGVSKGAATMINTIGWLAEHDRSYLERVSAVILDSPFASPESVATTIVRTVASDRRERGGFWGRVSSASMDASADSSLMPPTARVATSIAYPEYMRSGITPIKAITTQWALPWVDRNMVVVLIHSQADALISVNDSRELYCQLLELGFNNVYLIEVTHGAHAQIFTTTNRDRGATLSKLRLVYQHHRFPLTDELAHAAELPADSLAGLQPALDEVQARMRK